MPTQSTTYNSRVTDESLEKRFRDTFRSQGGAELVDDLYAQGVIVPIVDFTAAATGTAVGQNLQTAWDFTTGNAQVQGSNTTLISNAGFWKIDLIYAGIIANAAGGNTAYIRINDGSTTKPVWGFTVAASGSAETYDSVIESSFVVFLRSGDTLEAKSTDTGKYLDVWYRQIATVSGDLVNPSGFTAS